MITFYPRNLRMWKDHFDFNPSITLVTKAKNNHQGFRNREELIEFCKGFGVRLDDAENPFQIVGPVHNYEHDAKMYVVQQGMTIGWLKDDYR